MSIRPRSGNVRRPFRLLPSRRRDCSVKSVNEEGQSHEVQALLTDPAVRRDAARAHPGRRHDLAVSGRRPRCGGSGACFRRSARPFRGRVYSRHAPSCLTAYRQPAGDRRRIRAAREQAGLSQRQLSFEGCTAAYISRIEAGARTPSFQILRVLAETLGVSADFLATGEASQGLAQRDELLEAELAAQAGDGDARDSVRGSQSGGERGSSPRVPSSGSRAWRSTGRPGGAVGHLEAALASGLLSPADAGDAQALLGRGVRAARSLRGRGRSARGGARGRRRRSTTSRPSSVSRCCSRTR